MKIKIASDIKSRLNKKYISEVPVVISVKPDYRSFLDNHSLFIKNAISRGSCLSLLDVDFRISETTFWDSENFEDYAKYIFWTFNEKFCNKLIVRTKEIKPDDISSFIEIFAENPHPYIGTIGHPTDPYLNFCGKKLQSLNKNKFLNDAYELDKHNRERLLHKLKAIDTTRKAEFIATQAEDLMSSVSITDRDATKISTPEKGKEAKQIGAKQQKPELAYPERKKKQPFTDLLKSTELKNRIQEKLTEADIPFMLFKKANLVGNNRNPDGFNSAVAVMIVIFKSLGYFKEDFSFDEILDAYLKETGNSIGKINHFKRHYMKNKYFKTYKEDLFDLNISKID
ncbi:MAG TPA: hypothetical protein DCQ50_04685 [Chryseobacterium sp.]|nr:hypothetical protein [Chryseobacterium sp.]